MIKFITGFSLLLSATILLYLASPIPYYLSSKQERLYSVWQNDISKLSKDKQFGNIFSNLSNIEILFTDPQDSEEFQNFKTPFTATKQTNPSGYVLKISITRWTEEKNYGFIIQHEIFDANDDKLHEFGRTYKIGLIF